MDAGSMALFSLACLLLFKLAGSFAKAVDKATMEVADYTVVIKGLPETTPIDVRTFAIQRHVLGAPLSYRCPTSGHRRPGLFFSGVQVPVTGSASSVTNAGS
jgi:hypothetical protein